ncbi:hypothetical protein MMC19_005749 [Ptychographa xylographoides]|nr:hypothetical protein [Ptychographa xylographoides]
MPSTKHPLFPPFKALTVLEISAAVAATLNLQNLAVTKHDKRPFAAMLLAPDNTTVLLSHFSIDHVNHAESCLARLAATHYSQLYLWTCTLVSTWEPCAMCAGTIYWANIGRVIFAASECKLRELTGNANEENFTMSLAARDVLKAGQKPILVVGPVLLDDWEEKVVKDSDLYWKPIRERLEKEPSK